MEMEMKGMETGGKTEGRNLIAREASGRRSWWKSRGSRDRLTVFFLPEPWSIYTVFTRQVQSFFLSPVGDAPNIRAVLRPSKCQLEEFSPAGFCKPSNLNNGNFTYIIFYVRKD